MNKIMKTSLLSILCALILIISCTYEETNSPSDRIIGQWKLYSIAQRKDGIISILQNGIANFEFSKTNVQIDNKTHLIRKGTFNYCIRKENYFDATLEEPKTDILIIDNQKFIIEIDSDANNLKMTNYSDGRIIYYLEK
jgi:hypothetical protein